MLMYWVSGEVELRGKWGIREVSVFFPQQNINTKTEKLRKPYYLEIRKKEEVCGGEEKKHLGGLKVTASERQALGVEINVIANFY